MFSLSLTSVHATHSKHTALSLLKQWPCIQKMKKLQKLILHLFPYVDTLVIMKHKNNNKSHKSWTTSAQRGEASKTKQRSFFLFVPKSSPRPKVPHQLRWNVERRSAFTQNKTTKISFFFKKKTQNGSCLCLGYQGESGPEWQLRLQHGKYRSPDGLFWKSKDFPRVWEWTRLKPICSLRAGRPRFHGRVAGCWNTPLRDGGGWGSTRGRGCYLKT